MNVDIEIGGTKVPENERRLPAPAELIEGRVLQVRTARGAVNPTAEPRLGEKRQIESPNDPLTARTLTIMVKEGFRLPEDLEGGEYRVFLHIVKR